MGDAETIDVGAEPQIEEAPITSADTGGSELPPVESPEPEREPEETPQEAPERPLGDKDVNSLLTRLKSESPQAAERLRSAFNADIQFRSDWGNPRTSHQAKIAFDTVGGVQGIVALREQLQSNEWVNQAAESGDPALIDDWAEDYPKGFATMMPHALKKWASVDQQGFNDAISPHVFGVLDRSQLADRLVETSQAIASGNKEAAQSLVTNIYNWLDAQKQNAQKLGQQAADPRLDQLQQRENALREREETHFQDGIAGRTVPYQVGSVEKALAPYIKSAKLSGEASEILKSVVMGRVNAELRSNPTYQRQIRAFLFQHDARGAENYVKAHVDTIVPGISRRTAQEMYGTAPRAFRTATVPANGGQRPAQASPSGFIQLARKPAMSELVKTKSHIVDYIAHRGVMASGPYKGKLVTWK